MLLRIHISPANCFQISLKLRVWYVSRKPHFSYSLQCLLCFRISCYFIFLPVYPFCAVNSGIDFPNFLNEPVFHYTLHFISGEIVLQLATTGCETQCNLITVKTTYIVKAYNVLTYQTPNTIQFFFRDTETIKSKFIGRFSLFQTNIEVIDLIAISTGKHFSLQFKAK